MGENDDGDGITLLIVIGLILLCLSLLSSCVSLFREKIFPSQEEEEEKIDCKYTTVYDTNCSKECGGGTHAGRYNITRNASNGGQECPTGIPPIKECNTQPCPQAVDCQYDIVYDGICSKDCGTGSQTGRYNIITAPENGGQACPIGNPPSRECNIQPCPLPGDCEYSIVYDGDCSKECGTGLQTGRYNITKQPVHSGQACPTGDPPTRECNTHPCPVDCKASGWSNWSACDKPCGEGSKTRIRTIIQSAKHGGATCPPLSEIESCNTDPCPVDCKVSGWGNWSACDKPCGEGSKTRTRTTTQSAEHGGETCPPLSEIESCNTDPCPIDCEVSGWSNWSACTQPCGEGSQTRTRTITKSAEHGGATCPPLYETRTCNNGECAVDCEVSGWGQWSACDTECGDGKQTRTRTITKPSEHGGSCPPLSETQYCNNGGCPVDCKVNEWGTWSSCSSECGPGTQIRQRSVNQSAENGGSACPPLTEIKSCNNGECPIDCKMSPWSAWDACNRDCGPGTRTRTRTVTRLSQHGGEACPTDLSETQSCNNGPCPVDCVQSGWSSCSTECGPGTQTRTTITQPANGGAECGISEQPCNNGDCPVDCVQSGWSSCSTECGPGTQTRTTITQPANGGAACGPLSQSCNNGPCPSDCVQSKWSECSTSCGPGTQTRSVITPASNGGTPCGISEQQCNNGDCPIDCEYTIIHDGVCTKECGGGTKSGRYNITQQAENGGKACPTGDPKPISCNSDPCPEPIYCEMSEWSKWSECSKPCGGGTQTSSRTILQQGQNGAKPCPTNLTRSQNCNTDACIPTKTCWIGVQQGTQSWSSQGVMTEAECDIVRTNNPTVTTIWSDTMPDSNKVCPLPCPTHSDPCKTNYCIRDDQEWNCVAFDTPENEGCIPQDEWQRLENKHNPQNGAFLSTPTGNPGNYCDLQNQCNTGMSCNFDDNRCYEICSRCNTYYNIVMKDKYFCDYDKSNCYKCYWLRPSDGTWQDYSSLYPTKTSCENAHISSPGGVYSWQLGSNPTPLPNYPSQHKYITQDSKCGPETTDDRCLWKFTTDGRLINKSETSGAGALNAHNGAKHLGDVKYNSACVQGTSNNDCKFELLSDQRIVSKTNSALGMAGSLNTTGQQLKLNNSCPPNTQNENCLWGLKNVESVSAPNLVIGDKVRFDWKVPDSASDFCAPTTGNTSAYGVVKVISNNEVGVKWERIKTFFPRAGLTDAVCCWSRSLTNASWNLKYIGDENNNATYGSGLKSKFSFTEASNQLIKDSIVPECQTPAQTPTPPPGGVIVATPVNPPTKPAYTIFDGAMHNNVYKQFNNVPSLTDCGQKCIDHTSGEIANYECKFFNYDTNSKTCWLQSPSIQPRDGTVSAMKHRKNENIFGHETEYVLMGGEVQNNALTPQEAEFSGTPTYSSSTASILAPDGKTILEMLPYFLGVPPPQNDGSITANEQHECEHACNTYDNCTGYMWKESTRKCKLKGTDTNATARKTGNMWQSFW
jgi:Spondin-like TSP1 domain/PAN domain/Thrombospondin type 1 domain